jgi:hypothetical protein
MADAHIQSYLNQGYVLHTAHPGAIDQTTSSASVFYILIRETQPDMDVPKAQEQINQMVSDELAVAGKWVEKAAPVPA